MERKSGYIPREAAELAHLLRGAYTKDAAIERIESDKPFEFLSGENGPRTFRQAYEQGDFCQILDHYRQLNS